jgi:hypothetical protein
MHKQKNRIDPNEGYSRSSVKSMRKQKNCIDPNEGDKPEFGKIDA